MKAVRETRTVETMQRSKPVAPILSKGLAAPAINFKTGTAGVCGTHLEAGSEYDAVDFVFDAVVNQAFVGNSINSPMGAGIDQRYIGIVASGQIFVVESRSLAEKAIPRLQCFRGLLILD